MLSVSVGYSGFFLPSQNGCVFAFCSFTNSTLCNYFLHEDVQLTIVTTLKYYNVPCTHATEKPSEPSILIN